MKKKSIYMSMEHIFDLECIFQIIIILQHCHWLLASQQSSIVSTDVRIVTLRSTNIIKLNRKKNMCKAKKNKFKYWCALCFDNPITCTDYVRSSCIFVRQHFSRINQIHFRHSTKWKFRMSRWQTNSNQFK